MLGKYKGLVKIDCKDTCINSQKSKLNTVIYDLHSVVAVEIHFVFDVKEE